MIYPSWWAKPKLKLVSIVVFTLGLVPPALKIRTHGLSLLIFSTVDIKVTLPLEFLSRTFDYNFSTIL
jgi:hypothetical protein